MSGIAYFIPIIFWFLLLIWFITCTKHEGFPWIVPIIITGLMFVPIFNWILVSVGTGVTIIAWITDELYDLSDILKDNWFNRFFLGYRDE